MNKPPEPIGPTHEHPACPECGSREVTDTDEKPVPHPRPVHVVRLKCKRGHVWSPA